MKKLLLILLVATVVATSCTQQTGVVLSGVVENAGGQKIYLERIDLNESVVVDSTVVGDDGEFELQTLRVAEPTFFKAKFSDNKAITFIADTTEHIKVTADMGNKEWLSTINFTGSEESVALHEIILKASKLQSDIAAIGKRNTNDNYMIRKEANDSILKIIEDYKNFVHQFVFENARSFVSYYALFQNVLELSVFDVMDANDQILFATVATSLNLIYPESERAKHLYDYVLQAKAIQRQRLQNEQLLDSATEVKSPDLNLPDLDGNTIKLSSLRGKIVVLTFWASTNEQSRGINRQLKSLYEKYKTKGLEIYQVSFDTSRLLWQDAMMKDGMTWTNVCDLQGANSVAARLYNVNRLPSNYILDRDGALVGKDLFGARLENRIAELLK